MSVKTNIHQIRTPEGIVFSQLLAGPAARFSAWLVDGLIIMMLSIIMATVLALLLIISPDLAGAFGALGYFVISIGYGVLFEWSWRGQTVGKKLFRLRVVDADGLRLQFNQIVMRNLLRFVDSLPAFYFVGGVVCLFNKKCQRLGDLAANTIVIRQPIVTEPNLEQLLAGKFNSLRQYPHLEARLRQRVSPAEAAVLLQAIMRRDEFDLDARVELYRELADYFRARAEFPAEATDGIADEQYLRNLVDVLYRPRKGRKAEAQPVAA
jgi:uncharacterized RDD family membrane protein YckC